MTLSDVSILGKKILVGIIVTVIPFVIIAGGLWLGQRLLTDNPKPAQQTVTPNQTNTP